MLTEQGINDLLKAAELDEDIKKAELNTIRNIAAFLLNKKASAEIVDKLGNTPLMMALSSSFLRKPKYRAQLTVIVNILIAKSDVNARKKDGDTALHLAACD